MRGVAYVVNDVKIGLYILVVEFTLEGIDVSSPTFSANHKKKAHNCRRYRIDCRTLPATGHSSSGITRTLSFRA